MDLFLEGNKNNQDAIAQAIESSMNDVYSHDFTEYDLLKKLEGQNIIKINNNSNISFGNGSQKSFEVDSKETYSKCKIKEAIANFTKQHILDTEILSKKCNSK